MNKRERSRIEQSIKELTSQIAALQARAEPVAELLGVLQRARAPLDKRLTIYRSLLVVEDELDDQPMALAADVRAGIDAFLSSTNEPSIAVTSDAGTQAFVEAIGEKAREMDDKAAIAAAKQQEASKKEETLAERRHRLNASRWISFSNEKEEPLGSLTFQEELAAIEAAELADLEKEIRDIVSVAGTPGKAGPLVESLQERFPQYDIAGMVNAMRSHKGTFKVIKVAPLQQSSVNRPG